MLSISVTPLQYLIVVCFYCDKRTFNQLDGYYYKQKILLGPTSSTVHVDECRRTCKLDPRCFAFQMLWTDSQRGYCETVAKLDADFSSVQPGAVYTMFGNCRSFKIDLYLR